jgi:hypothetical protein
MNAHWQWQDDAIWQSCSPAAKTRDEQWQRDVTTHHESLRALAAQQPLIDIADDTASLHACTEHAAQLRSVSELLVVMGTGGASLGAHALTALCTPAAAVRFLENLL